MSDDVISVLTFKSVDTILATEGTQSWALDRNRASKCRYVVMYRNSRTRMPEGPEPHGKAFMVGKVRDVVPSTEDDGRWLIRISEYAVIPPCDEWEGRNPVAYWTTDDFEDIDFEKLVFETVVSLPESAGVRPLTINEAKEALAKSLGVGVDQIEIIVRG